MTQPAKAPPPDNSSGCFGLAWCVSVMFDCAGCLSGRESLYYVGIVPLGLALLVITVGAVVGAWAKLKVPPPDVGGPAVGDKK